MKPSDCAILVPIGSHLEPETEEGLRILLERGYVVRTIRGTADVVLARCSLATEALRDGFKETLWIDSDIAFNPDDVEKIRQRGPFVAGLYARKQKNAKTLPCKFKDNAGGVFFGVNGGLVEMVYVGMGFTYIRAEVYDAMNLSEVEGGYDGKKVKPFFLPVLADEGRGTLCYLAEDLAFCHRAAQAGYPPVADTTIQLGHVGRYVYTISDMMPKMETDVNEEKLLARVARQMIDIEERKEHFGKLLNIIANVIKGDVHPSRVMVNVTDQTCHVWPEGEEACMPATINGLPSCVVGNGVKLIDAETLEKLKERGVLKPAELNGA